MSRFMIIAVTFWIAFLNSAMVEAASPNLRHAEKVDPERVKLRRAISIVREMVLQLKDPTVRCPAPAKEILATERCLRNLEWHYRTGLPLPYKLP